MRYTVDWSPAAKSALAAIWIRSLDRRAVTLAQHTIDQLLAANPHGHGKHESEGLGGTFMNQIILNDEQVKQVTSSPETALVCDPAGRILGTYRPIWTAEEIAQAEQRLAVDEPCCSTSEVLAILRSLPIS